jgi:hypothetical protein
MSFCQKPDTAERELVNWVLLAGAYFKCILFKATCILQTTVFRTLNRITACGFILKIQTSKLRPRRCVFNCVCACVYAACVAFSTQHTRSTDTEPFSIAYLLRWPCVVHIPSSHSYFRFRTMSNF